MPDAEKWTVVPGRDADKHITKLAKRDPSVIDELARLETDPHAGHRLAGALREYRSLEFSLKGGGVCRAVYWVDDENRELLVLAVGPHESIYRNVPTRTRNRRRKRPSR